MSTITIPTKLRRAGMETRTVIESGKGSETSTPDQGLFQLVALAQEYQASFLRGCRSITVMAAKVIVGSSCFTRLLRVIFLAPDIHEAIADGRLPPDLSDRRLMANAGLPIRRFDQRARLGID